MPAVILFVVLAAVFGLATAANKKVPVPEGCEDRKAHCAGCEILSCANRVEAEEVKHD